MPPNVLFGYLMAADDSSPQANLAAALARISLIDNTGATRSLAGKKVVMFYFSAHWCGPCKFFTPTLQRWYQRHAAAKQVEVVFVSNDRNETEFKHYFDSM